jgi:hypothetical protein
VTEKQRERKSTERSEQREETEREIVERGRSLRDTHFLLLGCGCHAREKENRRDGTKREERVVCCTYLSLSLILIAPLFLCFAVSLCPSFSPSLSLSLPVSLFLSLSSHSYVSPDGR